MRPLLLLLGLLSTALLTAQSARPNQSEYQISIRRASTPIQLDGLLDEEAWRNAEVANDFWEKEPRDDRRAHLRTEARMTYDDVFLYASFICYDTSRQHVVQTLKRDVDFWGNDVIALILDPMNEATNGFIFGCNTLGVQMESLLSTSGDDSFGAEWDNKWFVETSQGTDHWAVEMAIPFKTLRFQPDRTVWGVNFERGDAKHNQFHMWARVPRQFHGFDLGYTGRLVWDASPPRVKGNVSLIPYLSATNNKEAGNGEVASNRVAVGADAKVAITSSLNLDLTVNPDFSQVEVDQQVTNLTRFSIFFPERRNFFLENSDLFTGFGIPPVRPFFSRRIGLDQNGRTVPILFGARLTGNLNENLRIGLLDVHTDSRGSTPAQNYLTAAFSQRVLAQSSIKGMFINRQAFDGFDPDYRDYGRNASLEFNYRSADSKWDGWTGYHHSFQPNIRGDNAFWNIGGAYTSRNLSMLLDWVNVGTNYVADVGFVNRIDNYDALRDTVIRQGYRILYVPITTTVVPTNSDWLQEWNVEFENEIFFNPDYKMTERATELGTSLNFRNTSELGIGMGNYDVALLYPYAFTDGEPLPAGWYEFTDVGFGFSSDQRKPFGFGLGGEWGEFYNGRRRQAEFFVFYRRQPWGLLAVEGEYNKLIFPTPYGEADFWLVGPRLELNFSKNLFWTTFVQYNTQADNFNVNSRLQWQFRPLSWVYLVYTDNYALPGWGPKLRSVVLKVNYWLTL